MAEPSFNTWTSIFLVVALHGFALSAIFLLRNNGRKRPNLLLGTLLFLFSLNLVNNLVFWTNYGLVLPHMMAMSATFHFLYGPLFYFYVINVLDPEREWRRSDLIHLLPFALYFIWVSPIYFQSAASKLAQLQEVMQNEFQLSATGWIVVTAKTIHMAAYTLMVGVLYYNGEPRWTQIDFNRISEQKNRWTGSVTLCMAGYVASYILFFLLMALVGYSITYDYAISFAMSGFIFTVGYLGFLRPDYLYEAHNGLKYENSSLNREKSKRYLEQLLNYMEKEKPYRDGDLRINDLAEELSIPSHHLSQVINNQMEKNFFEFVNSYRIRDAKTFLSDPEKKDFKVLRIAFESGFNNKTSFNNAFKSEVGMTPTQFRKRRLNGH